MKKYSEKIMHVVFLIAACASILAVILICAFLFVNGIPTIGKIGLGNFVWLEFQLEFLLRSIWQSFVMKKCIK